MRYSKVEVENLIEECTSKADDVCINKLEDILLKTEDVSIRNGVAMTLKSINNPRVLPTLIKVIENENTYKYRATLVFVCDDFDCTPYFDFFSI